MWGLRQTIEGGEGGLGTKVKCKLGLRHLVPTFCPFPLFL